MKTIPSPLAALALLAGLAVPSHALWPFSDPAPAGPLGAVLAEVSGAVNVKKAGAAAAAAGAAQTALDAGDVVTTGAGGQAVVAFLDGSKMLVRENSAFAIAGHSAKKVSVKIDVGTLQYWIAKQAKRRRYELRTPTAVASVRGTSGEVEVALNGESSFAQWTGSTDVTDSRGNNVRLEANQQVTSDDQKGLEGAKVEPLAADKQPEPEPTVAPPPPGETPPPGDAPKEEPKEGEGDAAAPPPSSGSPTQDIQSPVSGSTP
jgi:ferric-dicitrate binding protein FerR (iron transport regulator)